MRKPAFSVVVAAIVITLAAGGLWWLLREPDRITVVSWGGEYGAAQATAMLRPYTDESGVDVRPALYGGGLAEVQRQVESGRLEWDVIDFELPDAAEACRRGWLETINSASLPPGDSGAAATADFVPGAIGPCWVGSVVYAQVIAFERTRFARAPVRAADFFDLAAFPGGRGMKDAPKGNLELALIAAGVPVTSVYQMLSTPEGVALAFAKLDTIRAVTVWWRASGEPIALIAENRVTMTTALNGRVLDAIVKDHRNLGIVWDGQRYELDVFGIPRGTLNKDNALDFIRFATGTFPLARVAELVPYGPARRSSIQHVGYPERGAAIAGSLPTAHFGNALLIEPGWWAVHGEVIEARWKEWRSR